MIIAKKSLGQNFLIDEKILKKITNITNIKDKTILEVGPGTGNSRTHTGSRCANVYGSYSDTSNSPHYSELTILEIQP